MIRTLNQPGAQGTSHSDFILQWGADTHGNSTSARYLIAWNQAAAANASESVGNIVIPYIDAPLYIRNLRVKSLGITPTVVYTLRKNGVDTGLTINLASGVTSGLDSANVVAVVPGDVITLKSVTSSADNTTVYVRGSARLGFT